MYQNVTVSARDVIFKNCHFLSSEARVMVCQNVTLSVCYLIFKIKIFKNLVIQNISEFEAEENSHLLRTGYNKIF